MAKGIVLVFIVAALGAVGCAKRESHQEGSTTRAVAQDSLSPQPTGALVGKNDPQINSAAPKLKPWVVLWQHAIPGFLPESLYLMGTAPAFRGGHVQPLKNVYPPPAVNASAFLVFSARSPDGAYNLIFDRYQCIAEDGEELEIGGDPDSGPLLLDLRRGVSNQFETCGTPCGFDWGVWLSPTEFALAGWQDVKGTGPWKEGRLAIYSLEDSTSTTYVTRPIPPGTFAKYRATWEAWVASRYRALKPVKAHS